MIGAWGLVTPLERVRASNPFSSGAGGWRWRGEFSASVLSGQAGLTGWSEASLSMRQPSAVWFVVSRLLQQSYILQIQYD